MAQALEERQARALHGRTRIASSCGSTRVVRGPGTRSGFGSTCVAIAPARPTPPRVLAPEEQPGYAISEVMRRRKARAWLARSRPATRSVPHAATPRAQAASVE